MENVNISKVCGLCAGCKRAITVAENELKSGKKVTIFKEIVHNKNVNNALTNMGAKFEDELENLKDSEMVIIRAHGEPPETYDFFKSNNIEFKDCTCPRVEKIHEQVNKFSNDGYTIVLLGKFHKTMHPEVFGTIGWANGKEILIEDESDLFKLENLKNKKFYLVCQTTFNIKKADELILGIETIAKSNNCEIVINKSICDAQKMINISSADLAKKSDIMIVVGGKNSSNSIELFKNMQSICPSIFIENILR
jgi:4-hydroxy-3-methylbut-2-enyl diphosphate reductase